MRDERRIPSTGMRRFYFIQKSMPVSSTTTKGRMRSRAQWKFLFATGKPFAKRWARSTPGGKVKRFRKLPGHVKKEERGFPLLALFKANYGAKKGQVIQGRLVRGEGGRFASGGGSGAAKPAASTSSTRRSKRPPPKTEEQRAADREAKRQQRIQERAAQREENITSTFSALDLPEDAADSLRRLAAGEPVEDDGGLVKMGLAEQAKDGSYRLTATGRAVMNAAERGDLGAAKDAKSRAQDTADKRAAAEAKKLLEEAKPAGGGGGGKKKEPPKKLTPLRTSQTPKPVGGSGKPKQPKERQVNQQPQTDPALVSLTRRLSQGDVLADDEQQTLIRNGLARETKAGALILTASGARAIRTKESKLRALLTKAQRTYGGKKRKDLPDTAFAGPDRSFPIVTAQDVRDAVRSLGRTKHDKAVVKRGITRRARAIGATSALPESWSTKAFTPTRQLNAGHTGVMVALRPDEGAIKAITALPGVTEPANQIHMTLAFLGDSKELSSNKDHLLQTVAQWAARASPLKGVINGAGRFFHTEEDGTNAVWVSPDVGGLPDLREELTQALDSAGLDYAKNHGFTPHVTVAYIPKANPTPPIRIEQPVTFDCATVAWGDEQYDFALGKGMATKKALWSYAHEAIAQWERSLLEGQPRKPYNKGNSIRPDVPVEKGIVLHGDSIAHSCATPPLTVYKDSKGQSRWIARSTTAYRDRDREILPIATLDQDSQRMTKAKSFGPLRWWHVGRPDATQVEAPWGPGLDLGMCDFSVQIGRTRVESGTFKDEAIARRIANTPSHYELSPGFFHAADEPDADGIFRAIYTFERSLVPIKHARASNLFTGLVIKEHTPMDPAEQERRLKAAATELGLTPEQEAALKQALVVTDKAAATATDPATGLPGVAFKSADEAPPAGLMSTLRQWLNGVDQVATKEDPSSPDPNATLIAALAAQSEQIASLTSTLKAAMEAPVEEETAEEVVEEEVTEEEAPLEGGGARTLADIPVEEFVGLIGQALSQALAGAMGGISDKVAALDDEMKGMGYTRVKEEQERTDKIAALKAQIDQQQAQLAELLSDQPAIQPTRPSQSPNNILRGMKDMTPSDEFAFADIAAQLIGPQRPTQ